MRRPTAAFAARDAAAHEEEQRAAARGAGAGFSSSPARIEPLARATDLTLKAAERALKDLRTALGTIPQLPSKHDYDEIVRRLKAAQTALTPKVQELRDIADWQRWANVGIQEQLCEKMEALKALDGSRSRSPGRSAICSSSGARRPTCRARRARRCGAASRRRTTKRGRAARRISPAQAEARAENLAKKIALCERAEALADSTHWIQTADEIKKLQAEWKTIGPVHARTGESDLGTLPRRLRSLLHAGATPISPSARRRGPRTWRRRKRCA